MRKLVEWCALAATAIAVASGCGAKQAGGGPPPPQVATQKTADMVGRCGPEGLLDDCEDGNNQILKQDTRGGYWYSAVDTEGSTVEPPAGSAFPMTQGGARGSGYAAHIQGKIAVSAKPYAVVGFNFVDPKDAYDASKFGGVTFWAKSGSADANPKVRLKLPDINTDPQGSQCTACFNDFGVDLVLSTDWTEYVLTWQDAQQMPDWGAPRPPSITSNKLYAVQWQTNTRGKEYDIWVDDIAFVGCKK
jgi:endoglucanase